MKKLALLLGALSLVSSVAYAKEVVPAVEEVVVVEEAAPVAAAPALRVTSFGQEIEVDNTSGGSNIGEEVYFYNNVGLAYGDNWTFGLSAAKIWDMDTDDGIHSSDARLQIDVWNQTTDTLKLGFRYRGQKEFDRYYARYDWSNGVLWSAGDFWYQSNNTSSDKGRELGTSDNLETEWFPIGLQYGPVKVGYFINAIKPLDSDYEEREDYIEHQIRAYATLYKGEKVTVSAEGRFTLTADDNYKKDEDGLKTSYVKYDDFGRNRVYLGVDYAVSENLNVYTKYGYEFRNWTCEDLAEGEEHDHDSNRYYGEFYLGWNYAF